MKSNGEIYESLYNQIRPRESPPAQLYGLEKVHKTDTPMGPVLSMPGYFFQLCHYQCFAQKSLGFFESLYITFERVTSSKLFIRLDLNFIRSPYILKLASLATISEGKTFKLRKNTGVLKLFLSKIIKKF